MRAATLVLEPEWGGDLVVESPKERIVEQFKTRSRLRTWTPAEIIESVLPDLYRSVDPSAEHARYRFVTDGRCPLPKFQDFFAQFRDRPTPDNPQAALDDSDARFPLKNRHFTSRGIFQIIVDHLDNSSEGPANVWHLLSRLEIEDELLEEEVVGLVDAVLVDLVDVREHVENKRQELIGKLLDLARRGAAVNSHRILTDAGLDPIRLSFARRLPAVLNRQLAEDVRALGYDRDTDVRSSITLSSDKGILILSGDSGQGKTWRLCRVALDLESSGQVVLLLTARGGLESLRERIVERVWHSLGYDTPLSLPRLVDRVTSKICVQGAFWLTICVDDVQDRQLLSELLDPQWRRLGIRLILSAQPRIARSICQQGKERVALFPVTDFTLPELRSLLQRHDKDWNAVPDDVLGLIRRPILASIYCLLDQIRDWTPENEYTLVERYWHFATREYRGQDDHRRDAEVVKTLAAKLLETDPYYPWPTKLTIECGLNDEARQRLMAVGLLRDEEDGGLAVSHDRLLNWMVAEWLSDSVMLHQLSMSELFEILSRITRTGAEWGQDFAAKRLMYVPLDVLWLLSSKVRPDQLASLLLALGRDHNSSQAHNTLFRELLPTLGARILASLVAIFRQPVDETNDWWLADDVGCCIIGVGESDPKAALGAARELLEIESSASELASLNALAALTADSLFDRLWEIHLKNACALDSGQDDAWAEYHHRFNASFDALVSAAKAEPKAIERKIEEVDRNERADQLVYVLLRLDSSIARDIWLRIKGQLFAKTRQQRRCLAQAIRVFKDRDELGWLENWEANNEDNPEFDSEIAARFNALAHISPERALAILADVPSPHLGMTRGWWLPTLIFRLGEHASSALLKAFDGSWERLRDLAIIYSGHADLLDAATLIRIIDELESRLAAADDDEDWEPKGEWHFLHLISSVCRPDLLEILDAKRGSRFEDLLTKRATRRPGRTSLNADRNGELYRWILLAIGGNGIRRLVKAELERPNKFARRDGLDASLWCPTEAIRVRLRMMAAGPATSRREDHGLATVLAALGEDAALVELVRAGSSLPIDVLRIRDGGPQFADSLVSPARSDVSSDADEKRRQQAILVLALANRSDVLPTLLDVFDRFQVSSTEAHFALVALDALNLYSPILLPKVRQMLDIEDRRREAFNYLLRLGNAKARAILVDYLSRHQLMQVSSLDTQLAHNLLRFEDSADGALDFLRKVLERGLGWTDEGRILRALAQADDSAAKDQLYEVAARTEASLSGSRTEAIEGLADFDLDAAFAMALRQLSQAASPRTIELVMTLDAPRGLEALLQRIPNETSTSNRWATGRALRWYADPNELQAKLLHKSMDLDPRVREATAELCGWQLPDFLNDRLHTLVDDDVVEVEKAALESLRQQQEQKWVQEILSAIPTSDRVKNWSLLFAAINLGDPDLLTHPKDPLYIGHVLEKLPPEYTLTARRRIKKRRDELKRSSENTDRHRVI